MAIQPAYRDAERTNDSPRSAKIYKDLNLNFGRHPVTKQIQTLTDAAAVKRSVRNLVQIGQFEKPFHPEIASGVRDILFENITPFTAQTLARKIEDVITNFEPRALLTGVEVIPRFDNNEYEVIVEFFIQNAPSELIDLSFTLERLR
jgi:phage baseplate assembly protein W|tara:strand:- start:1068 stop:1508 length:441 start_codon:yes stop_codon:yes gene_type:complete